jgi:hypothetical protein
MAIFNRKPKEELPKKSATKANPKEKVKKDIIPQEPEITPEMLDRVDEVDFSKITDPDLALFVKYYILFGGNGKRAYTRLRNGKVTENSACVGANKMLRRLRQHPDFLDIMGLGYQDLREILSLNKPEKVVDVLMRINKEDTERVEGNFTHTIKFEKDLDD